MIANARYLTASQNTSLGCTGARLIVTLLYGLRRTGGKYGLAALCIGGGQAMAAIIERL